MQNYYIYCILTRATSRRGVSDATRKSLNKLVGHVTDAMRIFLVCTSNYIVESIRDTIVFLDNVDAVM